METTITCRLLPKEFSGPSLAPLTLPAAAGRDGGAYGGLSKHGSGFMGLGLGCKVLRMLTDKCNDGVHIRVAGDNA